MSDTKVLLDDFTKKRASREDVQRLTPQYRDDRRETAVALNQAHQAILDRNPIREQMAEALAEQTRIGQPYGRFVKTLQKMWNAVRGRGFVDFEVSQRQDAILRARAEGMPTPASTYERAPEGGALLTPAQSASDIAAAPDAQVLPSLLRATNESADGLQPASAIEDAPQVDQAAPSSSETLGDQDETLGDQDETLGDQDETLRGNTM